LDRGVAHSSEAWPALQAGPARLQRRQRREFYAAACWLTAAGARHQPESVNCRDIYPQAVSFDIPDRTIARTMTAHACAGRVAIRNSAIIVGLPSFIAAFSR
jgi:hypothetical protein